MAAPDVSRIRPVSPREMFAFAMNAIRRDPAADVRNLEIAFAATGRFFDAGMFRSMWGAAKGQWTQLQNAIFNKPDVPLSLSFYDPVRLRGGANFAVPFTVPVTYVESGITQIERILIRSMRSLSPNEWLDRAIEFMLNRESAYGFTVGEPTMLYGYRRLE